MERKGKKEKEERIDMQHSIEVDEEDFYTLKINCNGKNSRKGKQRNKWRKIIGLKN